MFNSVRCSGVSVESSARELCSIWAELTGPFSPLLLTGEEFPRSVRLVVEGGGPVFVAEGAGDLLGQVERVALEWLALGVVPRPLWRVLGVHVEILAARVPDLSREDLHAVLRGEIDPRALPMAVQVPIVSGSSRGAHLLEVAAMARGLVFP